MSDVQWFGIYDTMCGLVTRDCSLYVLAYFWGVAKAMFSRKCTILLEKMSRLTTVAADLFYYNTKSKLDPNCTFDV